MNKARPFESFSSTLATFALLCVIFLCRAHSADAQLPFTLSVAPEFNISWGISSDSTAIVIQMTLRYSAGVWLGIGWHELNSPNDGMTKADFVIGLFDDNGQLVSVMDYYSSPNSDGFAPPQLDTTIPGGENNIISYAGIQVLDHGSVITTFTFQRKLVTNDTVADHPLSPGFHKVVYAHGKSNAFGFHGLGNAGQTAIDFATGAIGLTTVSTLYLKQWHGSLMFTAFVILLTLGIFVARYTRNNWFWFKVHFICQMCGISLAITGFILAIIFVEKDGRGHFNSTHAILGIITISLACIVVPVMGMIAHMLFDPNRKHKLIFPNKTHYWMGRITILLSYVTVFFGIEKFGLPNPPVYMLGVLLAIFGVIVLFQEFVFLYEAYGHLVVPRLPDAVQRFMYWSGYRTHNDREGYKDIPEEDLDSEHAPKREKTPLN